MGHLLEIFGIGLVFSILVFVFAFEETIKPIAEAQLLATISPNEGTLGSSADGKYFENNIQVDFNVVSGILNSGVLQEGTETLDQGEIRFGTPAQWNFLHTPTGSNIMSINFWFKGDLIEESDIGNVYPILSTMDPEGSLGADQNGIILFARHESLRLLILENGIEIEESNLSVDLSQTNDGQWHMITLAIDHGNSASEEIITCLDTVCEPEFRNQPFAGDGGTAAKPLTIGGQSRPIGEDFVEPSFEVDDFTIWHGYFLTSSDIVSLYNGGLGSSAGTTGSNIAPTLQLLHVTFDNVSTPTPDADGDGILYDVDTLSNTYSDDFSDIGLVGTTSGTITTRGDQILTISEEPNPDGVRITADISGGLVPATINACGGLSLVTLSPGDNIVVTCGSVTIDVIDGQVDVTLFSAQGIAATTTISQGNSITFDQETFSFVAPLTNTETIIIDILGGQVTLLPDSTEAFGFLKIIKLTTGVDDAFDFILTGHEVTNPRIETSGGSGVYGPILVVQDSYSIEEINPPGWALTTASCNDGSSVLLGYTIYGNTINPGDNVECTFENEFVGSADIDGDGILGDIDTLPNTYSDDFSDIGLVGTTSGTITTRGDQILTISEEPNPDGVRITADISGGLVPATINTCGGLSLVTLSPGDNIIVTCGSVTIDVVDGPVDIIFMGSGGTQATTTILDGNSITFDQDTFSFVAPLTNTQTIIIDVQGMLIPLNPGEDASLNVLSSNKSSFIKQGELNTNEGANTMMRVRDNGNNRALVSFDQNEILSFAQGRTLSFATLRLYIEENGNNWGPNGRTIDVHRLVTDWTEGNGFNDKPENMPLSQFNDLKTRGIGQGVTWECATDAEINNQQTNCSTQWNGATFSLTSTDTVTIFKDNPPTGTVKTVGWIEFDVTSDVQTFLSDTEQNYGWIVKKTEEGAPGLVEFTSDESPTNTPELILVFD